jgi:hypothetical protein
MYCHLLAAFLCCWSVLHSHWVILGPVVWVWVGLVPLVVLGQCTCQIGVPLVLGGRRMVILY